MSRRRADLREAVDGGLKFGLLFGGGAFLLVLLLTGLDYWSTRDAPTEQATVISVEQTDAEIVCGRRSFTPDTPGLRTVMRSETPPADLPVEFSVLQCPAEAESVGNVVPVRRTGEDEDNITLYPIESPSDWFGMSLAIGAMAAVSMAACGVVRELWSVRRSRLRRARRRQNLPDPSG